MFSPYLDWQLLNAVLTHLGLRMDMPERASLHSVEQGYIQAYPSSTVGIREVHIYDLSDEKFRKGLRKVVRTVI